MGNGEVTEQTYDVSERPTLIASAESYADRLKAYKSVGQGVMKLVRIRVTDGTNEEVDFSEYTVEPTISEMQVAEKYGKFAEEWKQLGKTQVVSILGVEEIAPDLEKMKDRVSQILGFYQSAADGETEIHKWTINGRPYTHAITEPGSVIDEDMQKSLLGAEWAPKDAVYEGVISKGEALQSVSILQAELV